MSEEDKDSKTEEPTEKRISKAREEGDVALSQEIGNLGTLIAALVALSVLLPWVLGRLYRDMAHFLETLHLIPTDLGGLRQALVGLLLDIFIALLPLFGLLLLLGVGLTLGQVGFLWTPKKLSPKLNKINPISGVKKVISAQKAVDLLKSIVKVGLIGAVLWLVVIPLAKHPDVIVRQDFWATLEDIQFLLIMLLFTVTAIFAVIAVADLVYQRHKHNEKLKMTKQEVKDEHKQSEGDPQVKSRLARLRLQRHRDRMMANVPTASVVITNPTHYAVALLYDSDTMNAPRLVAKGVDFLAAKIREVATENDVPIVENPPLARALYAMVELDQEIPPDHYKAVAEVIGYVMRLKQGAGAGAGGAAR